MILVDKVLTEAGRAARIDGRDWSLQQMCAVHARVSQRRASLLLLDDGSATIIVTVGHY